MPNISLNAKLPAHLTLRKLDVLRCVAEFSSVTKAAQWLNIAQPAVTAHLRDLEDKLGVPLVRRVGRDITLTEAGHRVVRWAEAVVTRYFEMQRELGGLADGTTGSAVIAASMSIGTYLLTEIVVAFQAEHPNTVITTTIGNTTFTTEAVRTGSCDFGVLLLEPKQDLEGLVLEPWWNERLVLIAAIDDHRVGEEASPEELSDIPFVVPPSPSMRRESEDEMLFASGLARRRIALELGHPEAIKRAVLAKAGISFLEESAVRDEVSRGLLRVVSTQDIAMTLPVYIAYRRSKTLSEMQRRLMDFVRASSPAPDASSRLRKSSFP